MNKISHKAFNSLLLFLLFTAPTKHCLAEIVPTKDPLKSVTKPFITLTGLTPHTYYTVTIEGAAPFYKKKANECGVIKISAASINLPFDQVTLTVVGSGLNVTSSFSSLPQEAAPKCTDGVLTGTNLTPSTLLRTAENDFYITGLLPWRTVEVSGLSKNVSRVKTSTCGILRVGETDWPVTITDDTGGAVFDIPSPSTVPTKMEPFCKNGNLYTPIN